MVTTKIKGKQKQISLKTESRTEDVKNNFVSFFERKKLVNGV